MNSECRVACCALPPSRPEPACCALLPAESESEEVSETGRANAGMLNRKKSNICRNNMLVALISRSND